MPPRHVLKTRESAAACLPLTPIETAPDVVWATATAALACVEVRRARRAPAARDISFGQSPLDKDACQG